MQKAAVMVGAKPTGHYWLNLASYLKDNEMKLVLVNSHHVKKSKEMDDKRPSKSDRKDPKTIAKLVHEGRYNEPYIPEGRILRPVQCGGMPEADLQGAEPD